MRRKVRFGDRTVVPLPLDLWHSTGVDSHDGIPCCHDDGEQVKHQPSLSICRIMCFLLI